MTPNRRLKQVRELRGWSQAKVAEQLGTDATTVSRWERGLFSPTPYFRERLCTLFGKNAEELGLLESGGTATEEIRRGLSPRPLATLAFPQENAERQEAGLQTGTIVTPIAPSWPQRGDTFEYILDSAAHDQQAHTLWEDAYVRVMRGQRAEAQQLGEASLNAFEHVGHPNAEALREWLQKNELTPPLPSPTNIPSVPLPLLPPPPKRNIKHIFRRRNIGLAFILLAIAALGLASFSSNQSLVPRVQAGIQAASTMRTQLPAQKNAPPHVNPPTATAIVVATATPKQVPTPQPTARAPILNVTLTPASLTPANCMQDSGYRCTLYVTLYSSEQGNLYWQASSTSLPVQFNPGSGISSPGSKFEIIAYIQSSPGQSCRLIVTMKFSSYTVKASVSWHG